VQVVWWLVVPRRYQPAQQDRCPSAVPACSPSSRAPLSGFREQIREHRVGRLEPAPRRAERSGPQLRTAAGRVASAFEGVRRQAGPEVASWWMASPALEVPTLASGNCASWTDRSRPHWSWRRPAQSTRRRGPLILGRAARKADPASMAAAAAKVSRTRWACCGRFAWVLMDPLVAIRGRPTSEPCSGSCKGNSRPLRGILSIGNVQGTTKDHFPISIIIAR
jgi:hypothetical protein